MPQITARFSDGHEVVAVAKNPLPFAKAQSAQRAVAIVMGEGSSRSTKRPSSNFPTFPPTSWGAASERWYRSRPRRRRTSCCPAARPALRRTMSPRKCSAATSRARGLCPFLRFGNFTSKGITGTPAAAGHYKGFTVVAGEIEVLPIWQEHDKSQHYDPAVGLQAPYLAKSQRNIRSEVGVQFGEDRWVEPDPARCRPVGNIRFLPGSLRGEPLQETSALTTAVGVVTPTHSGAARACAGRAMGSTSARSTHRGISWRAT